MKQSRTLLFASKLLSFIKLIIIISIFLFSYLFIHARYSPQSVEKLLLTKHTYIEFTGNITKIPTTYEEYKNSDIEGIFFNKLSGGSKFKIWMSGLISLTFVLLIINQLRGFVNISRKEGSFFYNTSQFFKKSSIYCSIYLCLSLVLLYWRSSLSYIYYEKNASNNIIANQIDLQGFYININSYINLLFVILFLMVASKVFKEGEKLKSENQLTV
ncbi:hypothetical protein [Labilibacter marinus]|uniref:hypothetical protein n=1 Tax=Labilibacter marinus TaxID=1477105 RepID=UPI00082C7398|nr:hypothetical protein [Labilibacter marinus]